MQANPQKNGFEARNGRVRNGKVTVLTSILLKCGGVQENPNHTFKGIVQPKKKKKICH